MSSSPNLRERRRAATLAEIKAVALRQLATSGPDGLALRAVAREVGVSVQALYHYFDSREALITALVADAHNALADAVDSAFTEAASLPWPEDLVTVALAYRRWAVEHRGQFLLIYGVPLPDYRAPQASPTTTAAHRLGRIMCHVMFRHWSPEEVQQVGHPVHSTSLEHLLAQGSAGLGLHLPTAAMAVFIAGWAQLHGMIMLEVLDHLPWLAAGGEDMCRFAILELTSRIDDVRTPPTLRAHDAGAEHQNR